MKKNPMNRIIAYLSKSIAAPFFAIFLVLILSSCNDANEQKPTTSILIDEESEDSSFVDDSICSGITDSITDTSEEKTTSDTITETSKEETEATIDSSTADGDTETSDETTTEKAITEKVTTEKVTTAKPTTTHKEETTKEQETTTKPKDYNISLELPSATGEKFSDLNGYIIDYSNVDSGYVMVKSMVDTEAVVQVRLDDKKGALAGQYVLKISNNYVAIPLTKGNVTYCVRIMQKNPESGKYAEKNAVVVTPTIANERQPFKIPNVYVYYMKSSTAVNLSYKICDGLTSDEEKVKAIYDYITKNIKYDYEFAKVAAAGYMDSERCLANKQGICGDYSVLFATMCRAQGIPCIVVEGYVTADGQVYHAWNQVYYNKSWHFFDTTFDASGGKGSNYLESFRY